MSVLGVFEKRKVGRREKMKMGERSVSEQKWKQRERGMKEDRRIR